MENPKLKKLAHSWLTSASLSEINHKLVREELTSRELVLMYLYRIATLDKDKINAIIEINPEALQTAEAMDKERAVKGPRGKLHGIPVLIKDNIATNDKMHTSAGSVALADSFALKDAFIVKKLREAGAIILGKTNMTEWANFMGENMPTGYSSRGGQVTNPYGSEFIVGGSSSGSGAAIAAGFATVAIGTETSGSILSPASQNSLVGIKPTVGLISRNGIIPISHTQDTAGPMTKTVEDAVLLLNGIVGVDENDPITKTNHKLQNIDFTTFLRSDGLKGAKIGIAREVYFDYLSEDKAKVINGAIEKIKTLGADVVDITIPSTKSKWNIDVLKYEFKVGINTYLKEFTTCAKISSLTDIISFNENNRDVMLKYGQKMLLESNATSGTLTEKEYITSLEHDQYHAKDNGIDAALKEVDAIVFPNNFGASIPAKAGYPSITIPAGFTDEGEPVGITFTSAAFSEGILLSFAYAYEQATKERKAPNI
ncbi:amidase family protein [Evansella cellulosilytica]|uniref:Amidase n=1 Tax=Evansella cellulosilytica (strain ATCC 21833 / DSM 2522 / FERM P-1141 / JCM 9156 / N-4) TaxID=649639 RepID=E6TVY5_EVAC2|nr:amidase family protein [Evansella cellulosilytica]ADU28694.1 Amidase [Evansella cellulosilytica DSM 2522]